MKLVTAGQMQRMDKETIDSFGIPGQILMENAGRGAFQMLLEQFAGIESKHICILAGRGNNGGDGFVMGRYLLEQGIQTTLVLLSSADKVKNDARSNMILFQKLCHHNSLGSFLEIPDEQTFSAHETHIRHHDIFVDAILGTGLTSAVKGFFKIIIDMLNGLKKPVFSVDIPSGLDSDTGRPCGVCVKASATATFAFAKVGHILYPGNEYTGILKVIDIGIPKFIAERENLQISVMSPEKISRLFQPRPFNSHKGNWGHLLAVAGSEGKTGAAVLCANAAMRCGTGLVTLAVPERLHPIVGSAVIEAMTAVIPDQNTGLFSDNGMDELIRLLPGKTALAIGPGIGTHPDTKTLVKSLIQEVGIPMVIDADGLNCIADSPGILNKAATLPVITPHPGEMARLTGLTTDYIQQNRIRIGRKFSKQFHAVLVLKGAQTLVCLPDQTVFICPSGNPGMASGGMGDVLTGIIAGFLAQGFSQKDAAIAGVYIHGRCADILSRRTGAFGYLASDIIQTIPRCIHSEL